jgi:hypothetical protein
MGLEGSLADFRITEIIQLIGQQFKTGVLHVESGRKVVEVFFLDGLIVHVLANYRSKRDFVGEILLKARKISQEQLEKVLKLQDETLQYAGEILVELRMLSEEEIVRVISTQVYETIYDLLTWNKGDFRFELRAVESYKRISIALSPEHVLLNVLRMMDEWPDIEAKISNLHVVFKRAEPLPKDRRDISPEQQMVYDLADGKLTLEEIIDRSLLGKFNACQAMVGLWEEGYVERVSLRKPGLTRMMGARVSFGVLTPLSTVLVYAMVLVVAVILVMFLKVRLLSETPLGERNIPRPQGFGQQIAAEKIRRALTVYYLENGEYPESLQNLVNLGLITAEDLSPHNGPVFRYHQGEQGGYVLKPESADGRTNKLNR